MYKVMCVIRAGMIGAEHEVSNHRSKAAAFKKMHSLNYNEEDSDTYFYVADEDYRPVIEVRTKRNGRWVIV